LVYEIDDLVFHEDIPDYNKFKSAFVDPKIRQSALDIMREMDEITVTNKFMQEYYRDKTGNQNITVIPNYPPKWWMGQYYDEDKIIRNWKKNKKKPRILYPASGAHFDVENRTKQRDDFFHVNEVIAKTVDKFQWVFVGAYPLPLQHLVKTGKIEFHPWQRLYEYPSLIDNLNCNMFIAPLQDNTFNKAKSDLKYIEACCYGLPIACQDLCTYGNAPYRFKTGDEMIDIIKDVLGNYSNYRKISRESRQVAETRWLEHDDNVDKYLELYKYPYKDPKRKLLNSLADNQ
jgi:glycosyltransferase involved in cell wall biosynthesis